MLVGAVMAGSVHDVVILTASVRHGGRSLAEIARDELKKVSSGVTASVATLLIIIVAMAGLGLVVVNALSESSWGTFTIAATIPIAVFMGIWMFRFRKGKTVEATLMGVILLTLAVIYGRHIPGSSMASWFTFNHHTLTVLLAVYGFIASVLPVWLLLSPRDYLSSIMKLGVVAMLAVGIIIVMPDMKMPAFTDFIHGDGPVIPGTLFPYLFITIACGAISGFHSLVSSGTTPKMIMRESHIRPIAVGSMLSEGMVSILVLIAAASLFPLDYFQINVPAEKFQDILPQLRAMGFVESDLERLSAEVGENVAGRTRGAVSLAVGMAQIFSAIPGLKGLMSYWYHFAIMFEALFILTTIDADVNFIFPDRKEETGDPVLDEVLRWIVDTPGQETITHWILRILERSESFRQMILNSLVSKHILTISQERVFLGFKAKKYPVIRDQQIVEVKRRVRDLVFGKDLPELRDMVIVSLAYYGGLLNFIFTDEEIIIRKHRIEQLARMDLIGQAISRSLKELTFSVAASMRAKEILGIKSSQEKMDELVEEMKALLQITEDAKLPEWLRKGADQYHKTLAFIEETGTNEIVFNSKTGKYALKIWSYPGV